ncbi:hypothetical protein AB0I61_17445 [Polymorphospora rubra]|uniref:hypothetical protein n=1 Tax=Polymorphospora rubra TaxID=338584 RepID=UPI0033C36DA8
MTDHDLMAWLGPAAKDLTAEQIELVAEASRDIDARYPGPDRQGQRDAALSATVQYLLGEMTPEDAARALIDARRQEREASAAAIQMAVMAHRVGGSDKKTAAQRAGIDRMTLLKALGER